MKVKSLSHVQLFATPWTVAYQAPPSMGFSRQEYWSGLNNQQIPQAREALIYTHSVTQVLNTATRHQHATCFLGFFFFNNLTHLFPKLLYPLLKNNCFLCSTQKNLKLPKQRLKQNGRQNRRKGKR